MSWYRAVIECESARDRDSGEEAARDIAQEFAEYRKHHKNVSCSFANGKFTLTAENDFDAQGLALMDEFSDCLSAYTSGEHGKFTVAVTRIQSVE
jgi:hypothetical protein